MTDPGPLVDYAAIEGDYAFFLAHSTETAAQIAALRPHVDDLCALQDRAPAKILDVGCGTGAFTERLLTAANGPPERRDLWLIEPVARHLAEATNRLRHQARQVVPLGADFHPAVETRFDLILANHSLYYVADRAVTVDGLLASLKPGGRLIVALLDRANALAQLWQEGFAAIGQAFPFTLADDVESLLTGRRAACVREIVSYRIAFPDRAENTHRVLRFLFGDSHDRLPADTARALFDPYRQDDTVVIETRYPHLIVSTPD